jgi:hypothetical protein
MRESVSLRKAGFIAVPPAAKPGFDHADVYRPGRRMYVAHTGADRVDVLDCERRAFLRSLPDLPGVAGVLIDEEHDLLFTSDAPPRASASSAAPTRASSAKSTLGRTRTVSPTTAAAAGCTRSTSANRWARTAPPPSSTSTRWR